MTEHPYRTWTPRQARLHRLVRIWGPLATRPQLCDVLLGTWLLAVGAAGGCYGATADEATAADAMAIAHTCGAPLLPGQFGAVGHARCSPRTDLAHPRRPDDQLPLGLASGPDYGTSWGNLSSGGGSSAIQLGSGTQGALQIVAGQPRGGGSGIEPTVVPLQIEPGTRCEVAATCARP